MTSEAVDSVKKTISEVQPPRRQKSSKLVIPRRAPSIVIPPREIRYITPDKTTCIECPCFPKEDPYVKPKKLRPCLKSPLSLYELAAAVVDRLALPEAFTWGVEEVARWMAEDVGLPQYQDCIRGNMINGMTLLHFENPSLLPRISIGYFEDIKMITAKIHKLYSTEFVKFARSIGLPPRYPLTHCTWFKSRTGPSWGIRQNWTRSDVLRWMKILMPVPPHLDHWDLVWYHKPEFPKVKFARVPKPKSQVHIPHYKMPKEDECREYLTPRKFRIDECITESKQLIWMERLPDYDKREGEKKKKMDKKKRKYKFLIQENSSLLPKKVSLDGLIGKDFILARRQMPKRKFLV